jgi:DNA helicase II / ATP-dependent DNA helicase PcrA
MIQPSPTAPEGSVTTLPNYSISDFPPTSAILCRNAAPLVSFAFSLLRRDVPCRVLGREIGAGLIKLIDSQKASDLDELELKLAASCKRELLAADKHRNQSAIANIKDKYACVAVFVEEEKLKDSADWLASLKRRISSLFDDTRRTILTLSTIHKAKGLEWDTVFILDRSLMPSPYATQPWQLVQERNLHYVAATRAKLDLKYITSHCWKASNETGIA